MSKNIANTNPIVDGSKKKNAHHQHHQSRQLHHHHHSHHHRAHKNLRDSSKSPSLSRSNSLKLRRSASEHSFEDDDVHQHQSIHQHQGYHGALVESEEFYRDQYLRMCEVNHALSQQIGRLNRENKRLIRSMAQYHRQLTDCRTRLEELGKRRPPLSTSPDSEKNQAHQSQGIKAGYQPSSISPSSSQPSTSSRANDLRSTALPEKRNRKMTTANAAKKILQFSEVLRGHTGAIYDVKYDPRGSLLASGSLDCSVRIWNVRTKSSSSSREMRSFHGHAINVSTLAWSRRSDMILSGSYDGSVRLWDVESGREVMEFELPGMVQSLTWAPDASYSSSRVSSRENPGSGMGENQKPFGGSNVFYVASTEPTIWGFDRRVGKKRVQEVGAGSNTFSSTGSKLISNDGAIINTVRIPLEDDSSCLASGDSKGRIRVWSLRTGRCIQEWRGGNDNRPVSCLSGLPSCRFMASNSYDDILRIYQLPQNIRTGEVKLLCSLGGYNNNNWPIKSAMFHGTQSGAGKSFVSQSHRVAKSPHEAKKKESAKAGTNPEVNDGENGLQSNSNAQVGDTKSRRLTLCATGSADYNVYVFDISGISEIADPASSTTAVGRWKTTSHGWKALNPGVAGGVEVLTGHRGRVYAVDFHPKTLTLASASEDASIRIWAQANVS